MCISDGQCQKRRITLRSKRDAMRLSIPADHLHIVRFVQLSKLNLEQQAFKFMLESAAKEKWGSDLEDDSGNMDVSIDVINDGKINSRLSYLFNSSEAQQLLKEISSLTFCAEYRGSRLRSCEVEAGYNIGGIDSELWTTISLALGSSFTVNKAVFEFGPENLNHPDVTALALEFSNR